MNKRKTILAVDDEPLILQAIEDLLEEHFHVLTSGSAEQALQLFADNEIAVVLSDQRMPGMNGDQFLSKVKDISQAARLLISGYSDMEALTRAINGGRIYAYIAKPWDPEHLRTLVMTAAEHYELTQTVERERGLVRALMDNIPDTIYFKDTESRFTRINQAKARFLGLTDAEEGEGRTDFDFLSREYAESAQADEQRIVETGEPLLNKVERLENADGSPCWLSTTKVVMRGHAGEVTGIVGISRDITKLEEIAEALNASGERFRQLATTIDEVFYIVTPDRSEVIYISPAYEKIWGRTCASLYADPHSWAEAIHPEDRERVSAAMAQMTLVDFDQEFRIINADQSIRWIASRLFPVVDENGKIFRYTGVARDISGRKRNEELLFQAKLASEAANLAKSEFLASMSHEIRTPMNAIIGMADLLADTELIGDQREYVQIFRRAGRRLLVLIDDILDFSKIESGHVHLEAIDFELVGEVRRAIELMAVTAAEKELKLSYCIDSKVRTRLRGDPGRLRQVLLNLIGNAIKFSHEGEIVVAVRLDPEAPDPDTILFTVADNGIGIPAEKLDVIFQNFVQADSSTTRQFGGTGLGLAICRRLVEYMGGRIWVKSEPGCGSTFHFTARFTPLEEPETPGGNEYDELPAPAAAGRLAGAKLDKLRILVAEDSQDNMFLIRAYLKNSHCVIDEAENGRDALRQFASAVYDLVLMDVQMPVMDGYAATRKIRTWERENGRKPTPILALTAHALTEDRHNSLEAGCTAHLTKPIEKSTLLREIQNYAEIPGEAEKIAEHSRAGMVEGIEEIIPAFLSGRTDDVASLLRAVHSCDFEQVRKLGHNMKGSGAGYGFPEITRIGSQLEQAGKAGNGAEAARQVTALSSYLHHVERERAGTL